MRKSLIFLALLTLFLHSAFAEEKKFIAVQPLQPEKSKRNEHDEHKIPNCLSWSRDSKSRVVHCDADDGKTYRIEKKPSGETVFLDVGKMESSTLRKIDENQPFLFDGLMPGDSGYRDKTEYLLDHDKRWFKIPEEPMQEK